jgi:hypothetical protein
MGRKWTSREGTTTIGKFTISSYAEKRVAGKWTHTDRRYVAITEKRGTKTTDHGTHTTDFRGDYELRILADLGLIKVHATLKDVRVTPYHDLRQLADRQGCTVYRRTFLGVFIDYAAKRQGITYHAATITSALAGLEEKIKICATEKERVAALATAGRLVTIRLAKDLGFCDAGIALFLKETGLLRSGKYSANDVLEALANAPTTRETFPQECRTIKAMCQKMILGNKVA